MASVGGETVNDKLLARAREMRELLEEVGAGTRGKVRTRIKETLAKADRDIPKLNRHIKQIKFEPHVVRQAVERHGGDKNAAAASLGCSLRTVYTALSREAGDED